jgi:hypothetical protein
VDNDFLNKVVSRLDKIKSFNKKTIFSISSTAKLEGRPYLTPMRINNDFCFTGCVVFEQSILIPLLEKIDGLVDIILVDTEKKLPLRIAEHNAALEVHETVGYIETGNLSKICFHKVKKSKIFEFKPNDLTVNAVWIFLSQRLQYLSGKKITILGAGNIGSKLALKLVECGAEVRLFRRDTYKGHHITQGLNMIKHQSTLANIQYHQNVLQASFMADVLIGATNGYPIIDTDVIGCANKNCLIVDLGKNNITDGAIKLAVEHNLEIYRADVAPAFEAFIYEMLNVQNVLENSYGRRELGYCTIVGGGYFGKKGEIVVNHLEKPTQVSGVSNGEGSLKRELNKEDKLNINRLMKEYEIENYCKFYF